MLFLFSMIYTHIVGLHHRMATDIEEGHIDLLKSDKPDREYEYFWLVFKKFVRPFLLPRMCSIIDELSESLNFLQQKKEYELILKRIQFFIDDYLDTIALCIMQTGNPVNFLKFRTTIYRWKRIDSNFKDIDCLETSIVLTMANYQKNCNKKYNLVIPLFVKYATITLDTNTSAEEHYMCLKEIFEFALSNKIIGIVYVLKDYIELTPYIKENIVIKKYMNARPHKLIKVLEIK